MLTRSQGLFSLSCSAKRRCTRSWEGAQPGQGTWTSQRDIPCLRTSHSVYKLAGIVWEGLVVVVPEWFGILSTGVNNCIVHHLSFLGFIFLCLFVVSPFFTIIITVLLFYFISSIKLLWSQPVSFNFFLVLLPNPTGGRCVCMKATVWLSAGVKLWHWEKCHFILLGFPN